MIDSHFTRLHYPCYWHYDILFALKVLAEASFIGDARCQAALALLAAKRLTDGGFPAEERYYRTTGRRAAGYSLVDSGGTSQRSMNPWVTVDALFVLRSAGQKERKNLMTIQQLEQAGISYLDNASRCRHHQTQRQFCSDPRTAHPQSHPSALRCDGSEGYGLFVGRK